MNAARMDAIKQYMVRFTSLQCFFWQCCACCGDTQMWRSSGKSDGLYSGRRRKMDDDAREVLNSSGEIGIWNGRDEHGANPYLDS